MMFEIYDLFEPDVYFKSCHAAFIVEMPNHELWVSFFGGDREKAKNVGSYVISKDILADKDAWKGPRLFLKVPGKSHGGVHFFVPPGKDEIWAFFNLMHGSGWSTCNQPLMKYKKGKGWKNSGYLRRMIGWNSRGKILALKDGSYLAPMHDELLGYKAYFLRSANGGRTWKKCGPIRVKGGCLEPAVAELSDGRLVCYLRTKCGRMYFSDSTDHGKTWSPAKPLRFPNPDSQIEAIAIDLSEKNMDDRLKGLIAEKVGGKSADNISDLLILCYNDSSMRRENLSLVYSFDGGNTWSDPIVIDPGYSDERGYYEVSYPCMIRGSDGNLHLVYTNGRKTIKYAVFDMEWLLSHGA